MSTKICSKCGEKKSTILFYKSKRSKDGFTKWCIYCRHITPILGKEINLIPSSNSVFNPFSKYNITKNEYKNLYKNQNGKCLICKQAETTRSRNGRFRRLSVDHNHKTGKVRGLLCHTCNLMLGFAKDDIEILEAAIVYLKKNQ